MQQQLEFWPPVENTPHEQAQWENLNIEQKAEGIAMLARLIARTICPQWIHATEENAHEQ